MGVFREEQGQEGKNEHCMAQILVRLLFGIVGRSIGSSAYGKDILVLAGR